MSRKKFLQMLVMFFTSFFTRSRTSAKSNITTIANSQFNNDSSSILVLTDSQCVDYNVFKKTANAASDRFPDAKLVTILGDLVDNGQANYQWQQWHAAAYNLLKDRIFIPVMGNHECYNQEWLNCEPVDYLNQFTFPDEGKYTGYYYSFDCGHAHFVVLNTQFDELANVKPKLFDEQLYWLRQDLRYVNRPWRIVLMHKDIFEYSIGKINDIGERLMPVFDELDIDLVLTGHLHTYRRRLFKGHKSLYILCGVSGDQHYTEPDSLVDEVSITPDDNYMHLEIYHDNLCVTCYDVDGTLLDEISLHK